MREVLEYLKNILNENDVVVIGNSGGPDSMALLTILEKVKEEKKIEIISAHINHNVRKESFEEKDFLEDYCKKHKITFEYMLIEKYEDDNFHNQARRIRYEYFEKIINKYNANYLMTAHHGDDLMETILMRITRGSTLKGYSGFEQILEKENYKIVRPLLSVTKKEIEEFDINNNIPFVIDQSNFKDKYTRNRYRKTVLPFLKNEDKEVHKKFIKFSKTLQKYDIFLNKIVEKDKESVYNNEQLDINKFNQLDDLIQEKIINLLLEEIYQDDLMLINDIHVKLIQELIKSKKSNSAVYLPNGIKSVKSYNYLKFEIISDDINTYEMELLDYVKLPNRKTIEKVDNVDSNDNNVCRINSNEIKLPLYVRTRRTGDRMNLKKINGSKKIKDIFIDNKVCIKDRDKWPIVVDSENKVIWIPGIKKSKYTKTKTEECDIIYKYS